jgi:4-diphosphocytidyl-2-C-methyl-D-erythritol kinase
VSNLGERIERVERVAQALVLLFPPFGCPTGAVYKAFDAGGASAGFEGRAEKILALIESGGPPIRTDELFNDLATPACHVEPRLRDLIDRLSATLNAHIHVTGSGSTLFALAESDEHAHRLAREARDALPEVAAAATRLV